MQNKNSKWHNAAMRLSLLMSGHAYDEWAQDIFYHQSCYCNFTYSYDKKDLNYYTLEKKKEVLRSFNATFSLKVVHQQEAFLLMSL